MTGSDFDLESYLTKGVERLVRDLVKTSLFYPSESRFMAQYALASRRASQRRHQYEKTGEHIPPFLIASITSLCNLHCAGCYARSLETCTDGAPVRQLSAQDWGKIFAEAGELGIGFILLAGGEPMVRKDVLAEAAKYPEILFPIFTNGTMISEDYFTLLNQHRNLIPVFSVEGGRETTDTRRGMGVYDKVQTAMKKLRDNRMIFGVSVTVTAENMQEVTSLDFVGKMSAVGCKAIFYVEYVPTGHAKRGLALDDAGREKMAARIDAIRSVDDSMITISFPGDEKSSGGCLAAGRGFFHINSHGAAEPCPFSPYSNINVKETSLREAMNSSLFRALQSGEILMEDHNGGCVLFQKRAEVEKLLEVSHG